MRINMAYKDVRRIENSSYKKRLTRNERYKLRRLSTMMATFLIVAGCTYITTLATVKWPDKWYLDLISAANVSVISERASQLPIFAPLSMLDIVNSIVISKTLIEDADKFANAIIDVIQMVQDKVFGMDNCTDYSELVKSGAYKGIEKWIRDFLKVSSYGNFNIDNIFRSMSESGNEASINYYLHNVAPTKQAYYIAQLLGGWVADTIGLDVPKPEDTKSKKKGKKKSF